MNYTELQEQINLRRMIQRAPKPVQHVAQHITNVYKAVEKQTYKVPKKIMQRVAKPRGNAFSKYGTSGVIKRVNRASAMHKATFGGLLASPLGMGISAASTAAGAAVGGVPGGIIGHELGSKGATAIALRSRYLSGKYDNLKDRLKRRAANPANKE